MSAIGMPAPLLAYFAPEEPLRFIAPPGRKGHKPFSGISDCVHLFETGPPPPVTPFEAPAERRARLKAEALAAHRKEQSEKIASYDPQSDEGKVKTSDPRKTLFVGRLSYETTEKKLLKTFEVYGEIRDIRLVTDKRSGAPRGYAFIEYHSTDSVWSAIRESADRTLDGRKILVDVEKARTKPDWLPRRLGGGEGSSRCVISKKQKILNDRRLRAANPMPMPDRSRGGHYDGRGGHMRGGPRGRGMRGRGGGPGGGDRNMMHRRGGQGAGGSYPPRRRNDGGIGYGGGDGGGFNNESRPYGGGSDRRPYGERSAPYGGGESRNSYGNDSRNYYGGGDRGSFGGNDPPARGDHSRGSYGEHDSSRSYHNGDSSSRNYGGGSRGM